jgi:transposase
MGYVRGIERDQARIVSLGDMVAADSHARLVDAFVEGLDMGELGFGAPAAEGRPAYDPRSLLKLYVWGYRNGVRSSRRLASACRTNVEAMWLVSGVTPDFRTISDFRKGHAKAMREVFHAFNERLAGAVEWGFCSVDGSKFLASNAKANNFTAHKLDDRISWLDGHVAEYLRRLDEIDALEDPSEPDLLTREVVEAKLAEARERLERYRSYRELMEREGLSQLSLTDADARLMKSKNGFAVAYNPQTAVDSETHLVRDFCMTNAPTDHGQLLPTVSRIADGTDGAVEVVADKGYQSAADMAACLEADVLPHVIADDGVDGYGIELPHEPADDLDPSSTDPAEISRCLHAGVVPDAYADSIRDVEVRTVRRKVVDEAPDPGEPYGTPEEMAARAAEGYFVRDPARNLVVCPAGESLRQKSVKRSGAIRYANKTACRRCPHRDRCFRGKQGWKEVDFTKDQLEKPCRPWHDAAGTKPDRAGVGRGKCHYEVVSVVRLELVPDISKTALRMGISEHPFGTIKRAMGMYHFLLRGLVKVEAEFSLMCLGYNMCRAANLLGFEELMGIMGRAGTAALSSIYRALRTVVPLWNPLPSGAATGATTC